MKEVIKTNTRVAIEVLSPVLTAFVEAVVDFVEVLLVVGLDSFVFVAGLTVVVFATSFLAC